ncbi:phosphotransferase [Antribacter gilvus]|uniref:phosphotransferase n=1 Tax=Antribacter gilvus TaxID=2304675 RepID=UPI000F7ADB97|nr:phosphotransferase [Antribacter gilvus]
MGPDEEALDGGNVSSVVRVGETVRRAAGPWTPTVHALLAWVRAHGVDGVPAPLGIDSRGREVLSHLPGEVGGWPQPDWIWDETVLADAATLLRRWHDASAGFPRDGATWRLPAQEPAEVICLNDVAPYNMVYSDGRLAGFIDVDMAAPGPRVRDLGYLAYRICPFGEDTPPPPGLDPHARLDLLLAAYGADAGISSPDVLRAAVGRLLDLADWSEDHSRATGRPELLEHAAMYRRDAARLCP